MSLLPLFSTKPTFDLDKDLSPVVECASAPTAFTVNAASGINTLNEYFDSVRKDAKRGSIGVPSPVSMGALVIYQMGKQLNLPLQAVPCRVGSPLLADMLGNQIPASGSSRKICSRSTASRWSTKTVRWRRLIEPCALRRCTSSPPWNG